MHDSGSLNKQISATPQTDKMSLTAKTMNGGDEHRCGCARNSVWIDARDMTRLWRKAFPVPAFLSLLKPCTLPGASAPLSSLSGVKHQGPSKGTSTILETPSTGSNGALPSFTLLPSPILSSHPPSGAYCLRRQPPTSSSGGRTSPAAPALRTASAEPRTRPPWPGCRA